jgi:hypothetical protein
MSEEKKYYQKTIKETLDSLQTTEEGIDLLGDINKTLSHLKK